MYQLSRATRGRSSYSDRRTNIGKPFENLKEAIQAAAERGEQIWIDNGEEIATVSRVTYANGPLSGQIKVSLDLPPQWLQGMLA